MKMKTNINQEEKRNIKNCGPSENNDTIVVHLMIKIKDQKSENVVRTADERDMIVTDPVCSRFKKYPGAGC